MKLILEVDDLNPWARKKYDQNRHLKESLDFLELDHFMITRAEVYTAHTIEFRDGKMCKILKERVSADKD